MKNRYLILFLPIMSFCLTSCGIPKEVNITPKNIEITSIHTSYQQDYLLANDPFDYCDDNYFYFNVEAYGEHNITYKPVPLKIDFDYVTDNGAVPTLYAVRYGENENNLDLYTSSSNAPVEIYNLKMNQKYYYQIELSFKKSVFYSEINSFTTYNDTGLRNMYIEGVENFRDLGGYTLENGKHFKQGMIYRSAQFNYDASSNNPIVSKPTSLGLHDLIDNLKIKTDVDVREKNNSSGKDETVGLTNTSPLGSQVNYKYLPMRYGYSNVLTSSNNRDSLLEFFNLLADENNYPLVFHCIQGKDRTGALAYAIEALLGVSEDDMKRDYLFTNFAKVSGALTKWNDVENFYPSGIRKTEGDTISLKARNYLKSAIGVNDALLDKIIDILSED